MPADRLDDLPGGVVAPAAAERALRDVLVTRVRGLVGETCGDRATTPRLTAARAGVALGRRAT